MVRWWDSKRSVTNLPRQVGLGGYNKVMGFNKPDLPLKNCIWLYIIVDSIFTMNNPQAHRSTEELKTIVKALSKLSLLNTPEEDQRLFECEQELKKEKRT